jgi:hypothetical protein
VELSTSDRLAAVQALATDAACAEVVEAWNRCGIESVLLKGVTTVEWLYRDGSRGYVDADLLVAPPRVGPAASVLTELGFVPAREHVSDHAHPWIRASDHTIIDLHTTIWGLGRPPARTWQELQGWVEPYEIGAVRVRVPNLPARALSLALHAAQHRDVPAKRADLRRALERTTLSQWQEAEELANRLGALPMMGVGLELEPAGRRLLRHLPLARAGLVAATEKAPLAIGFARLAAARGIGGKLGVLTSAMNVPAEERRTRGGSLRRFAWLLAGIPRTARGIRRAHANDRRRS